MQSTQKPHQVELPIPGERWPRLSTSLPHPRRLDACQRCGLGASEDLGSEGYERTAEGVAIEVLPRWVEHDDQDQPEPIVVVLCTPCSEKVIEPHPRLYERLPLFKPFPGAMGICVGCGHQEGLRCRSPSAKVNGGPGMRVEFSLPAVYFVDGIRGGRRTGWRMERYKGPATACSEFAAAAAGEG